MRRVGVSRQSRWGAARAGTYTSEGAHAVAHRRRRKAKFDVALARCDKGGELLVESVDPGNPLVKKLLGMQQRSNSSDRRQ